MTTDFNHFVILTTLPFPVVMKKRVSYILIVLIAVQSMLAVVETHEDHHGDFHYQQTDIDLHSHQEGGNETFVTAVDYSHDTSAHSVDCHHNHCPHFHYLLSTEFSVSTFTGSVSAALLTDFQPGKLSSYIYRPPRS